MVCAFLMLVGQWLVLGFEDRPMKADPQELIDRIRKDPYLNRDEKSQLIDSLRKTKHYGLVWKKKPEEVEENQRNRIPVLTEVRERAIVSEAADAPNHILIEGDNLDALVALTYTHEGKIDVIYIDPPYNTGNKDFIYNDCFVDKESPYRHSLWLSFMSRRLKIAKRLLSDKGVIFISIDDNEQAQLKLLCDEVFGERNFVGHIIWQSATDNNPRQISTEHEYVLCYAKCTDNLDKWLLKSEKAERIERKYNELRAGTDEIEVIQKELRKWIKENKEILSGVAHYNNVDAKGVYSSSSNSSNTKPGGYTFDIIHPQTGKPCVKPAFGWRWTERTFLSYAEHGEVEWGKDETTQPHIKKRIDSVDEQFKSIYYEDGRAATKFLEDLFGVKKVFTNPKPLNLIKRIIAFSSQKDSVILDFFAGSGTTLHATMALNAEDGGHRQCILVTNNENRICEEVTYVSNKKVIEGYINTRGETVKGLTANSLRYYKTDFIDRDKTAQNRRALAAASADLLCIREGAYNERGTFGKLKLKPSVARYFEGNGKHILLILNENAIEYLVNEIKSTDIPEKFKVYVFSPGDYAYDDEFEDVADRVELCAVPSSIYNAYEKVLPKRTRDVSADDDETLRGGNPGENHSEGGNDSDAIYNAEE